jgi:hypothetical protein
LSVEETSLKTIGFVNTIFKTLCSIKKVLGNGVIPEYLNLF